MNFSKISFIAFLIIYIFVEILFRDYAINTLGKTHLLSYQIETFEILGRAISAFGFTIFFSKIVNKNVLSFFYKFIFSFLIYVTFYFSLSLLMNNVHLFVSDKQKENAYYVNLFKQGSYYLPNVEKNLPFELNEDNNMFKTYYGLSSFLYSGNDRIVDHVKEFKEHYIKAVSENYFNYDSLNDEISNAYFPTVFEQEIFLKTITMHYPNRNSFNNIYESFLIYKMTIAFYSYTSMPLDFQRQGFKKIEENRQLSSIKNLVSYLEKRKESSHFFGRNTQRDSLFIFNNRKKVEELVDLFNRHHTNVYLSLFEKFIKIEGNNLLEDENYDFYNSKNSYIIKSTNKKNVTDFIRFHVKNNNYDNFKEGISATFKNISESDLDLLYKSWLHEKELRDFLNSKEMNYVYNKYNNSISEPKNYGKAFSPSYINNINFSFLLNENYWLYDFFITNNFEEYHDFLIEEYYEFHKNYIRSLKEDHKNNVKTVIVPPLILFLLNIALFLNISLLIIVLLESKIKNNKLKFIIQIIVFSLLILFLGSNKNLETKRYNHFFNHYANENMKIDSGKLVIVNWFLRKNNLLNNYIKINYNPINDVDVFISTYKAKRDIENNNIEKLFVAKMLLNEVE